MARLDAGECRRVGMAAEGGAICSAYVWGDVLYLDVDAAAQVTSDELVALGRWGAHEMRRLGAASCVLRLVSSGPAREVAERLGAPDISFFSERACLDLTDGAGDASDEGPEEVVVLEVTRHEVSEPEGTVYLVPHQDDELYTWGADIIGRMREGAVAAVLLTNGAACFVRGLLHDGGSCAELGDAHVHELSLEEFSQARDREFASSCEALGIPARNVRLWEPRMDDLALTVAGATEVVRAVLRAHPFARICAHAPRPEVDQDSRPDPSLSPHRDHCAVGAAVEAVRREGKAPFVEYCIEFYDLARFVMANPQVVVTRRALGRGDRDRYVQALSSYRLWDPDRGRYAIGWHSGVEMFEGALENSGVYGFDPTADPLDTCQAPRDLASYATVLQGELAGALDACRAAGQDRDALAGERERLAARVAELEDRVRALEGSASFRLGRALTAAPRLLRDRARG